MTTDLYGNPAPAECVTALEARDELRAALTRARQDNGDAPAGTIGDAMAAAHALELKFDDEVPWFHWFRDVSIPTYCKGSPEWQELAGALFALSNEEHFKPQLDQVPAEAAKEAAADAWDWVKSTVGVGVGVGTLAVLVLVVVWIWRK